MPTGHGALGYSGKRVIVAGAASRLGVATTAMLVEAGAEVHTVDVDKPDVAGIASYSACDIRDADVLVVTIDRIGAVVNMLFVCESLGRGDLRLLVETTRPKMLERADSAIACLVELGLAGYVADEAATLARAGIRMNGVALEGADANATALVLLASPTAPALTGTCLVRAAVLPGEE